MATIKNHRSITFTGAKQTDLVYNKYVVRPPWYILIKCVRSTITNDTLTATRIYSVCEIHKTWAEVFQIAQKCQQSKCKQTQTHISYTKSLH